MKKTLISRLVLGLFMLAIQLDQNNAIAEIQIIDDVGNQFSLDEPAKRIVALAPHLAEIVYAIDKGSTLVGAVSYSDYPEAAKKIPRVGSYDTINVEAILRLQPDLILAWRYSGGRKNIEQLRSMGIPVFVSDPRVLTDIGDVLTTIGVMTGAKSPIKARMDFDHSLELLREKYANKEPVSVFFQVWDNPLQTINGSSLISSVIDLCGGTNVFAHEKSVAPKINIESVLRLNPQVIIGSGMTENRPASLDQWSKWPNLQANSNDQIHSIPADLIQRHTPRVLEGAEIICQKLEQARQKQRQTSSSLRLKPGSINVN